MMSWWNAKYTNGNGDSEITFGSKYRERAKAVEKVCQAVIDKKVKTPDDVAVVVRCKDCANSYEDAFGRVCAYGICVDCTVPDDFFCASSKPKEEPYADDHN